MFGKPKNVAGTFKINLKGQDRTLKASFGAIEQIESQGIPILKMLKDTLTIAPKFTDIVDVLWLGLAANNDTRLSRQEIGEAVLSEGLDKFAPTYVSFLTYCVAGDGEARNENPLEKKS